MIECFLIWVAGFIVFGYLGNYVSKFFGMFVGIPVIGPFIGPLIGPLLGGISGLFVAKKLITFLVICN